MKQSEAIQILNYFQIGLMRYRSIVRESFPDDKTTDSVLRFLEPWVFGEKCPLVALQKVLDRNAVTTMEFYNFMVILHQFAPELKASIEIMLMEKEIIFSFPEPSTKVLGGWEPE